ncbi:bifunctional 4-hydroxy-2-oxoglutarate aldolase/2-dehydro-3-deoxy-phosphogluconate aldolase [Thermoleptolyngbya oregonensis NK1-22]|uniref:Bifunctional 4-hydroxy-2-oxoglutarate aldolase/2-dehydro-3-deoxy-phosphogluconate aldolase n=1 Tax=Thermoleptolyngbya oregonensis NK1-22 TaxID=2547457 RepID=A0AA96YF39_9CYAN|nr:bifunctional 4-hydroxy-2-oxoglutarate aldolase/2-dehydro-3-deoxy-phosphogluconate aldolase [Thermoleptolyngbya oregonensis NK1-22]
MSSHSQAVSFNDRWLHWLQTERAIAVIRAPNLATGEAMARAVAAGGMRLIEVTWNSDRPETLVHQLRQRLPDCLIGAGTITTPQQVSAAIASGAQFLFSPHTNRALIQQAAECEIPFVAGALTPTEIMTAWQVGAAAVKVFPIQCVGGADYLRAVREPLGEIPLVPTGGVTLENARTMLEAGAIAVGLAGQLFPKAAVKNGEWAIVQERAAQLKHSLEPSLEPSLGSRAAFGAV